MSGRFHDRKLLLFISMSLDGFIATNDDDLSWLSIVEQEGEDYGYGEVMERTDTYIVGRKTYDVVRTLTGGDFPQATTHDCYVITREARDDEPGVTFYDRDIGALIDEIRSRPGTDIYCDGGGQIVRMLMERNLIDEYIISVIPTMLGEGKRLFLGGVGPIGVRLESVREFDSGLVQVRYTRLREDLNQG